MRAKCKSHLVSEKSKIVQGVMRWFLLCLLLLLLGGGRTEEVGESLVEEDMFEEDCEEVEELGCSSFVNCGDCVSHPGCVYCRDPEFILQERFQIH